MTREEVFRTYNVSPNIRQINLLKINCYDLGGTEQSAKLFNEIYRLLIKECPYELGRIKRTKSGGIHIMRNIQLRYDICKKGNGIELIYLGKEGSLRFLFNSRPEGISGSKSFNEFKKICKQHGVDLAEFAISNGKEIKKDIESPKIELVGREKRIYCGAHHLDINSSYMAGIAKYEPKVKEVIEDIYNRRLDYKAKKAVFESLYGTKYTEIDINKDILTHTFGYCQSEWCRLGGKGYALAHWSKAAIEFNNRMIEDLAAKLEASGRQILAYNTDGIWYKGEVYHDENEGNALGQWKNDHIDCQLRFKSKGAYEFIENGKYYPVVRGKTVLERVKPRENWVWGDIFNEECGVIKFYIDETLDEPVQVVLDTEFDDNFVALINKAKRR